MKTVFVVIEKSYIDYEDYNSYPIGVYTSEEDAKVAIDNARLSKNSPKCVSFEEYLDVIGDCSPEDARLHYCNYANAMVDLAEYNWYVKEFVLEGA